MKNIFQKIRLKLLLFGIMSIILSFFLYSYESREYIAQNELIKNGELVTVTLYKSEREKTKVPNSLGFEYFIYYRHQKDNRIASRRVEVSESFYKKFEEGKSEELIILNDDHSKVLFPRDQDMMKTWWESYFAAVLFILGGIFLIVCSYKPWVSDFSLSPIHR